MPPKRDPPSLEESMAAMADNISKLVASTSINNEKLLATQTATSSQLDIIVKQLATQYEQTSTLIAHLTQAEARNHNQNPPPPPPPPPPHNNLGLQIRPPKLTLPSFDGSNPLDWLFQADQYFTFYNIAPPQRLAMTAFHLTGDALSWYKYLFNNRLLTTWDAFTRALETRFGPSTYDNHQAALFKLSQTSTVSAYQTEFERLSNCVVGLPPDALLNCFISGLRHDIQQELTIQRPQTITQAIGLAKLIEDKLNDQQLVPSSDVPSQLPPPPNQPLLAAPSRPPPSLPIKRLSPAEMQKRRSEGLCFNCPEKYHHGHQCNPPKFLLLQSGHDPPSELRDPSYNNVSLEDKARFQAGSIDTWS